MFERPWCGGIDTFHTKLYIERYGRGVFAQLAKLFQQEHDILNPQFHISLNSRYNLSEVFENVMIYSSLQTQCSLDRLSQQLTEEEIAEGLEEVCQPVSPESAMNSYKLAFR